MINFINNFRRDEDGAVTVDWVVLTAAMVGIAIAIISSVNTSAGTMKTGLVADMTTASTVDASGS
ncbi:hypothetical protein HCZ30_06020 [Marivivens donghaensis]|uniref:Pilus assembly protein n=1 Tax=Marivivens donghaensis TaxID=1699413 RepID=A0ABX0VV72_9RHOB|nr:hypothetical protein [Marivivens donghaensis]NIY71992.1 hypothetical protein [Marivivens donghaensis]